MCGIVGYTGKKEVVKVLLNGLERLEYRGYDSSGVAVVEKDLLIVTKRQGKLNVLEEELKNHPIKGHSGIGHTRWATHGAPNDINAHPHLDHNEDLALVHNGIIENFQELRKELQKKGVKFRSETDTEVISHLISANYKGDLRAALLKALKKLRGSYAVAVVHKNDPGRIVGARMDSPLILGIGKGENFLASDVPALLEHTKKIIYLENGDVFDMTPEKCDLYNLSGKKIKREPKVIQWDVSQAEKMGYRHFMLKEIMEQPSVLKNIIKTRIVKGKIKFDELEITKTKLKKFKKIVIVACGTAYHAGMVGRYALEKYTGLPVWVDQSSEFRYRDPIVDKETLMIVISQSGETADTLAALREAKKRGATVLAVCNVVGSSIARESDGVIYTYAGPEIAVASTKAYTAQVAVLFLFTFFLADAKQKHIANRDKLIDELRKIPSKAELFLQDHHHKKGPLANYATKFHKYYLARNNKSHFLYLARNINYPNALEGALKLKEISYISAEGYPAGEMKHGPIALIDENPWVVCIAPKSDTYEKMISNIQEVKARNGIVLVVATKGDNLLKRKDVNYSIEIPTSSEVFSPLLVVLPLQLLAYYVACDFGYDIDQPRNLAKSVTVE